MLTFTPPSELNGAGLAEELRAAGYGCTVDDVMLGGGTLYITARTGSGNEVGEQSRSAIQSVIDAHTGQLTSEQQAPLTVAQQLGSAITTMDNELDAWPADLAAGANLNQVGARVNLMAAQERRNTERLLWLARRLLGQYE